MKGKSILISVGVVVAFAALATAAAISVQDRYALKVPGGLAFSEFKGYEDWHTIAISHNGELLAVILGNPAMIDAYKAGLPGNGKPFPDGAKMAKIHWNARKNEAEPGQPLVPGTLHDIDFMVKDSKRFADSGGWGYGEFEYDAASDMFRPGTVTGPAGAGKRCQVRLRVPHDSAEAGLRFHRVSQEVTQRPCRRRAWPHSVGGGRCG
jgi:hypothetical protein